MNSRSILIAACTILLGIVSFFLANFYIKVEQIAKDISLISTNTAVNEVRLTAVEKRVTELEQNKKK